MTDLIAEIIAHTRREDRVHLMGHECKAILRDIGVPTTTWLVAKSAVIHCTGAGCVIAADACQKEGLELAELSPATVEAIGEITPAWHTTRNPIDLWPAIERVWVEMAYGVAIEAALRDEGVDTLVISLFAMPHWETYTPDFDLLRASGKPVLFCVEGNEKLVREAAAKIEGQGFPVYPQVNRAVFALSHLSKQARLRKGLAKTGNLRKAAACS